MAETEIVYIAVIPLEYPSINLVKAVAGIIGKDTYQTRLLLMGSVPRVVARCNGAKEAEALAQKLKEVGLTIIVCPDSELRRPFKGLRAQTIEFGDRGVTFKEDGVRVTLGVGEVFLIIKGTMLTYPPEPSPEVKIKLSPKASLLRDLPIMKKVHKKSGDQSKQPEYFLRLTERKSSSPVVEIMQFRMDYSFLGPEATMSSLTNFTTVTKRLKQVFPKAIFDEKLTRTYAVDIPGTTPDEDIDINCRLIYFQHLP